MSRSGLVVNHGGQVIGFAFVGLPALILALAAQGLDGRAAHIVVITLWVLVALAGLVAYVAHGGISQLVRSSRTVLIRILIAIGGSSVARYQDVGVTRIDIQRRVAKSLFAGAFNLMPGHVRDEFGDEPIQHFLDAWNERERGKWMWALAEIVQMCWVAGVERLRGAWQAVTQR